jgi:hypothetical protein
LQEREGQLWRYFGAIVGIKIPDSFGQIVFFGGLTISLWIVGLLGITGTVLWETPLAFACLGAIIGCRVSDSLFSRILLNNAGYRPNPGLSSVPLYLIESLALVVVFYPTIRTHTHPYFPSADRVHRRRARLLFSHSQFEDLRAVGI